MIPNRSIFGVNARVYLLSTTSNYDRLNQTQLNDLVNARNIPKYLNRCEPSSESVNDFYLLYVGFPVSRPIKIEPIEGGPLPILNKVYNFPNEHLHDYLYLQLDGTSVDPDVVYQNYFKPGFDLGQSSILYELTRLGTAEPNTFKYKLEILIILLPLSPNLSLGTWVNKQNDYLEQVNPFFINYPITFEKVQENLLHIKVNLFLPFPNASLNLKDLVLNRILHSTYLVYLASNQDRPDVFRTNTVTRPDQLRPIWHGNSAEPRTQDVRTRRYIYDHGLLFRPIPSLITTTDIYDWYYWTPRPTTLDEINRYLYSLELENIQEIEPTFEHFENTFQTIGNNTLCTFNDNVTSTILENCQVSTFFALTSELSNFTLKLKTVSDSDTPVVFNTDIPMEIEIYENGNYNPKRLDFLGNYRIRELSSGLSSIIPLPATSKTFLERDRYYYVDVSDLVIFPKARIDKHISFLFLNIKIISTV